MPHAIVVEFEERRRKKFDKEITKRESREQNRVTDRNPIASNINRECVREMVLAMEHPVEKIIRDHERLAKFEDAVEVAKRTRRELEDLDFEISDVETAIPPVRGSAGAVVLTGIVDFMLRWEGKRYAVEVKAPHPLIFEKLSPHPSIEDLDRYWWMTKWVDQLIAYLRAHNLPEGFVLLSCLGRRKWVHVDLSEPELQERGDSAIALAEEALAAYKAHELPGFAKDGDTCRSCWAFGVVCQPPIEEQAAASVDDDEFYQLLTEALDLKAAHARYDSIWEYVKKTVKATGRDRLICRDLAITVTERNVKAEKAPRPARVDKVVKVRRIGQVAKPEEEEGVA